MFMVMDWTHGHVTWKDNLIRKKFHFDGKCKKPDNGGISCSMPRILLFQKCYAMLILLICNRVNYLLLVPCTNASKNRVPGVHDDG